MVFRLNHGSTLCGPSCSASGLKRSRASWPCPLPPAAASISAPAASVAVPPPAVVPFAVVVEAAVAVAAGAIALAAAMAHLLDGSSLLRVPPLGY